LMFKKTSISRIFFHFPLEAIFFNPTKVAYQNFMYCHELAIRINQKD